MDKLGIALSLAGILGISAAEAGQVNSIPITASQYGAVGSLKSARVSADSKQYIGCAMYGALASSPTYVSCSASDAAGHYFYCSTYNPAPQLVQAVLAINPASTLILNADSSYHCTYIYSSNNSGNL